MILSTYYSHERRLWWYAVNGEEGDPIIVAPAIFASGADASDAGLRDLSNLARIVERRTGINPLA